jgi:hypothetical protein
MFIPSNLFPFNAENVERSPKDRCALNAAAMLISAITNRAMKREFAMLPNNCRIWRKVDSDGDAT